MQVSAGDSQTANDSAPAAGPESAQPHPATVSSPQASPPLAPLTETAAVGREGWERLNEQLRQDGFLPLKLADNHGMCAPA